MKRPYLLNVMIGVDQLLNAMLGGDPDETISSRAYRRASEGSTKWRCFEKIINAIFFWDKATLPDGTVYRHCQLSMLMEIRMSKFLNKTMYKADVYSDIIKELEQNHFKD